MKDEIIVFKIIKYINKIIDYCKLEDYESFSNNSMLVEASVFNLSQIGELSNKISDSFKERFPIIPWKQLYGLRNRIVHDYEGVNPILLWTIIEEDLEDLKIGLEKIVN